MLSRPAKAKLHAAAGGIAMLTILAFQALLWRAAASGSPEDILAARGTILWGIGLVLIPALAGAGISGAVLGRGWKRPEIAAKIRRMRVIAANGLLVLLPLAVALWWLASKGLVEDRFFWLQRLEMLAGLVNLALLGMNMRAGLRLRAPRRMAA
ncbi:hypothetical protein GVY41_12785 [Frigidibacter albus]|uniref:Transmembrane protein n=1 Tax=Frigidibacter albus TaxID=1465486 RepID=A0A6L8VJJ8_9RHOB|nr:hypothetical protein [Frigidibacter albus]MZQ89752.1 hypothetical protein [Frigidibacter albus]NBE31873.1 hypothetical protein [Frigidibacter albus]